MSWPSRASCRRIPRTSMASSLSTGVTPASAGAAGVLACGTCCWSFMLGPLSVLEGGDNRAMVAQAVRGQAAQEGARSPPWPRLLGPPTISAMPEPRRNCASTSGRSTVADAAQGAKPGRRRARKEAASTAERWCASENAALRAELERLPARYEGAVEPPPRTKKRLPEPEPEQFALVGPGEREPNRSGPPDEALDSLPGCCAGGSKSANQR